MASGLGERCAGGLSIYINKMLGAVDGLRSPDPHGHGHMPHGGCDVLVCSVGEAMEEERLRVVGELWQADFARAERCP